MTHPGSGNSPWQDWPSTATLVTAARLEAIENALDGHVQPTPHGTWTRSSTQATPSGTWTVLNAASAADPPVGVANVAGVLTFAEPGLYGFAGTVWWDTGTGLRIFTFGPNESGFPARLALFRTVLSSASDLGCAISGVVRVTSTTQQYAFGLFQSSGGSLNVMSDNGLPRISVWRIGR